MTAPRTAADRLRQLADERRLTPELFHAYLDEALAEAAAPYRTALERLVEACGVVIVQDEDIDWLIGPRNEARALLVGVDTMGSEARALLRREVERMPDGHEHYWVDASDDETGWHCTSCGLTEYPGDEAERVEEPRCLLPDDDTAVERLAVALYAAVNSHRRWADEALETHAEWIIQRLREARELLRREVGE